MDTAPAHQKDKGEEGHRALMDDFVPPFGLRGRSLLRGHGTGCDASRNLSRIIVSSPGEGMLPSPRAASPMAIPPTVHCTENAWKNIYAQGTDFQGISPHTAPAPRGRGRSAKRGRGGGYHVATCEAKAASTL